MDKSLKQAKAEIESKYNKKSQNSIRRGLYATILVAGISLFVTGRDIYLSFTKYNTPAISEYKDMGDSLNTLKNARRNFYIPKLDYSSEEIQNYVNEAFPEKEKRIASLDKAAEAIWEDIKEAEQTEEIKDYNAWKKREEIFTVLAGPLMLSPLAAGIAFGALHNRRKRRELASLNRNSNP